MDRRNFLKTVISAVILSPFKLLFNLLPEKFETYEQKVRRIFGKNLIAYWDYGFVADQAATAAEISELARID